MLSSIGGKILNTSFIPCHMSRMFRMNKAEKRAKRAEKYCPPIVSKSDLDSIKPDDARHYKLIKSPDGHESNSMNYHPRIHKFTKVMMKEGKYSMMRGFVDQAFYMIKLRQVEKLNKAKTDEAKNAIEANPQKVFLQALDNCKPILKLTSISRGGINYQVPVPMSEKEREFKATKFILSSCLEKEKTVRLYDRLANELLDAYQNQGKSIKKKIDIHKLAEANRAYAHFRWTK